MATMKLDFEIFVPREIIFELLTDSAHLREWYPATACETRQFSIDAVEGGGFSYRWGDAKLRQDSGTFTQLVAPEGFSARVIHDEKSTREQELKVKLTDAGGSTKIEITEDGFDTSTDSERCNEDWLARLQSMTSYLSSI